MNADSPLPARSRRILVAAICLLALVLIAVTPISDLFEQSTHRHLVSRSPEQYSIRSREAVAPKTITIRNLGDEIVVDPRIIVNGRKDWFSVDSILAEILEPGMSKRDKAIAIWRFVVANRAHDQPAHHHVEMHDPVRFFNVYGYGFCDDAATNFMVLAKKANVRSRVWTLEGHVVAEAFYNQAWHMFDADAEVYYLNEDRRTIASVEQLADNPALIRRNPGPFPQYNEDWVRIFGSKEDNRIGGWYRVNSGASHLMAFTLRPGESLMRSRQNWGHFVASRARTEPASYGNGRFTFAPVLRDGLFRKGATEATGITETTTGKRHKLIFAPGAGGEARITYPFTSPYPILSGRARIVGELHGDGDAWLEYSEDGERRVKLWTTSEAGKIELEIPLDGQFRKDTHRPVYWYRLTLGFTANTAGSEWHVEKLHFESDVQLAPHALPELEEGSNEVRYVDGGEGRRQVEVIFDYS